jgi:hypothetical protein
MSRASSVQRKDVIDGVETTKLSSSDLKTDLAGIGKHVAERDVLLVEEVELVDPNL